MSLFRKRFLPPVAIAAGATLVLGLTPAAAATTVPDGPALAKQLVKKVDVNGVNRHLIALQRIADTNGGTRAASTAGHQKSAEYIATKLEAAGFQVTRQEFPFTYSETLVVLLFVGGLVVLVFALVFSVSSPV